MLWATAVAMSRSSSREDPVFEEEKIVDYGNKSKKIIYDGFDL